MIGIIGAVLWIVGAILLLVASATKDAKEPGDTFYRVVFFLFGLLLVTSTGYFWGNGNPDSLLDNTLYKIESDPFNSTVVGYEYLIITATPITLSKNGSIIKLEEEPKYYSVTKSGKKIEQFKKGDVVLYTGDAIVIFQI